MFCDLVGYTALSQRLDAEELHEFIDFHSACCRGIERFDGFVARYLGDGSLTLFDTPSLRSQCGARCACRFGRRKKLRK